MKLYDDYKYNLSKGTWAMKSIKSPTLGFGSSRDLGGYEVEPKFGLRVQQGVFLRVSLFPPLPSCSFKKIQPFQ